MTEKPLNIYSFNANGLGEKNKRKAILNWIKTHHHGVLFLQETHSVEKSEEVWKQEFNCNHIYFSHGTSVSRGVSITLPTYINVQILNKRGFWKLNLSLLKDINYVNRVNEELENLKEQSKDFENKSLFWDFVKCKIRGLTVSYASYKSKELKLREQLLLKQLQDLEVKVSETPAPEYLNQYTKIKSELEEFYKEKAKASKIRARADFIENDEKYFFNMEKRNYSVKCIKCLKTPFGQITEEEKILQEEKRFYQKLYSEKILTVGKQKNPFWILLKFQKYLMTKKCYATKK